MLTGTDSMTYYQPAVMYQTTVAKFVKTVGDDIYRPCPSLASAENIKPLSAVTRKESKWWFGKDQFYPTEFVLDQIVQSQLSQVEIEPAKSFCSFTKSATMKIDGKLEGQFKALFTAELDDVDTITIDAPIGQVNIVEVNQNALLNAIKQVKLNLHHEYLREISNKKRRALTLVVGTLITDKPCTLKATLNVKVSGDSKVTVPTIAGGEIDGGVEDDKSRTLSLPAGTVLGYQCMEVAADQEGNMRLMVTRGSRGGFNCTDVVDSAFSHFKIETNPQEDSYFTVLSSLSPDLKTHLIGQIRDLCRDRSRLVSLHLTLKTNETHADFQTILSELEDDHVKNAVRALVKALLDLDLEVLSQVTALDPKFYPLLSEVLSETPSEGSYTSPTPLDYTINAILKDLNYRVIDKTKITAPQKSSIEVQTLKVVATALKELV